MLEFYVSVSDNHVTYMNVGNDAEHVLTIKFH